MLLGAVLCNPWTTKELSGETISPPAREPGLFEKVGEEVRSIFERSRDAVVKISARDRHGEVSGTGFFIDGYGTVMTAYSVAGQGTNLTVQAGDRVYPATRLVADPRSGIAMLRVDASTSFLRPGRVEELDVASPVVSIGYPLDLDITPAFGLIAGFDLKYLGRFLSTTHIRANVPVQRGQAGAPLLNMQGQVVGILVSGIDGGSACYALPIHAAEKIRRDYLLHGDARHGWVGVTVAEVEEGKENHRAVITELVEGAPAANSGLEPGDLVLRVGENSVESPEDVINASYFLSAGDRVSIVVWRDGRELVFDVETISHPLSALTRREQEEASPLADSQEMIYLRLGQPAKGVK